MPPCALLCASQSWRTSVSGVRTEPSVAPRSLAQPCELSSSPRLSSKYPMGMHVLNDSSALEQACCKHAHLSSLITLSNPSHRGGHTVPQHAPRPTQQCCGLSQLPPTLFAVLRSHNKPAPSGTHSMHRGGYTTGPASRACRQITCESSADSSASGGETPTPSSTQRCGEHSQVSCITHITLFASAPPPNQHLL